MKSKTLTTLICATAALAVAPFSAQAAKPSGGFKQATFKATLSGSQVTTWEYHVADDPDNQCDAGSDGYGDQTIKFDAKRTFRLNFTAPPKNNPNLLYTRGRPAVLTNPNPLVLDSTAKRDTDFTYGQPGPRCDGENGGGVDPSLQVKDCGTRTGTIRARFFYDWRGVLDDAIPTDHSRDKNQLKLETYGPEYNGSESGKLDETYRNCSLNGQTWAERQGVTYTTGNKLVEKQLFNKKRKSFLVSGSYITPITENDYTGQTILAWNLKLTRVK
jgi:hypothetical protein